MRSSNLRLSARLALLALVVLVASACVHRPQRADVGAFVARELQVDGATQRYQVFVPSRQAGGRHPPVVMFLHGSGERGSDNQRQTEVGLGPHIRRNRTTYPAIAVFPQIRQGESWNGANARMAMAMLDASVREFDGDDDRIVLTGISRGGYGVYELALLAPLALHCAGAGMRRHHPAAGTGRAPAGRGRGDGAGSVRGRGAATAAPADVAVPWRQ